MREQLCIRSDAGAEVLVQLCIRSDAGAEVLVQVLQLARMVAGTFMDLHQLVSGDRWAVDGANIAADASFGDKWCVSRLL